MSGGRATAALWILALAALTLGVVRIGPWLWPQLFPAPAPTEPVGVTAELPSPERVAEIVHRTLSTLGAPGEGGEGLLELPKGASARELQDALRANDQLARCEVYVTRVDDVRWTLRVFGAQQLLFRRDVRPWLPERPVVSGADPPELGLVVVFAARDDARLRAVGRWKSPLAVGVEPFAAHAVATARQAAWSSKGVVAVLDPAQDLGEQLASAPEAQVALLLGDLPEGTDPQAWLAPLARGPVALVDGRAEQPPSLRLAAEALGVPYLRRAGHLVEAADEVLALNLAVRRGYGIVSVDGTEEGLAVAEAFVAAARADGYSIVFPAEVARMHGAPAP